MPTTAVIVAEPLLNRNGNKGSGPAHQPPQQDTSCRMEMLTDQPLVWIIRPLVRTPVHRNWSRPAVGGRGSGDRGPGTGDRGSGIGDRESGRRYARGMEAFDVVVAGAGPAGSIAARDPA